jgi:hypothetical protein
VAGSISALYELLTERDAAAIPRAIEGYVQEHGTAELWRAVSRFAVLAYAPSQHAKHALLCCLAAHDLRTPAGQHFVGLLTECALYAAMSRQPWREAPIGDPPPLTIGQRRDLGEVREAIDAGDRLRAERWLSARMSDPGLARDFFTVACDDFSDLGHKLIIAVAAWKLAGLGDGHGRFATLRLAPWEWTAYRGPRFREQGKALDAGDLAARVADRIVAANGSIVSVHALFLYDAALEASAISGDASIESRVRAHLSAELGAFETGDEHSLGATHGGVPVYSLARDYGALLQMHAVVARLRYRFPTIAFDSLIAAAERNLASASSFEEWTFA